MKPVLAIVSAILTISLTALNAYWSHSIERVDSDLKVREAALKEQQLQLDERRERLSRYSFVQGLLNGVLTQNAAQKTLTINLITLALTKQESEQLFAGLQSSADPQARNVGILGSDIVALTSLILQMNDAAKENRIGAVDSLIKHYRANSDAVDQAISMLESPKLDTLSASGRINVLVFLQNTDASAWTPSAISRARDAITIIRRRSAEGTVDAREQTEDALNKLSERLSRLKG